MEDLYCQCTQCDSLCCTLEVTLSQLEITSICKKYDIDEKEFRERCMDGNSLRRKAPNENGDRYCVFYNELCTIYYLRPLVCKKFMCKDLWNRYNQVIEEQKESFACSENEKT